MLWMFLEKNDEIGHAVSEKNSVVLDNGVDCPSQLEREFICIVKR
jgi:hypothetical protein